MAQHLACIFKGSSVSPRSLLVKADELGWVEVLLFGEGDGGLEGWGHLVLDYLPVTVTKITRSVRGTLWQRKSVAAPSAFNSCGSQRTSMKSSMSRPFEPNALIVGQPFASSSSRRETRPLVQRWAIDRFAECSMLNV